MQIKNLDLNNPKYYLLTTLVISEKLDIIFQVLHKQRTFQVYGKKFRHIDDDFTPDEATIILEDRVPNETLWFWEQEHRTWVETDTGELLT